MQKNRNTMLLSIGAFLLGTVGGTAAPSSLGLYYQNYGNYHNYSANNWRSDVVSPGGSSNFGDGNQKIVVDPAGSGYKRLRITLKKNKFGSSNLITESNLAGRSYYTMEYRVKFANNWQFVKGGKLPGLAGGDRPGGGRDAYNGMSARFMWRRDSAWDGSYGGSTRNYLELYHYWRGKSGTYGDRSYLRDAGKNTWYTLKIRLYKGTGSKNGSLRCWVNGVKKHDRSYRYLGSGQNWSLNGVMHHYFYGGGNSSWAPSQDTQLFFDNFRVDDDWF